MWKGCWPITIERPLSSFLNGFEIVVGALFTNKPVSVLRRGKKPIERGRLRSLLYHRALGRDLHKLVIASTTGGRCFWSWAMLAAIGAGRIHTYESPTGAIGTMATTTPDLVIAADVMQPLNGLALVWTMRPPKLRSTRCSLGSDAADLLVRWP